MTFENKDMNQILMDMGAIYLLLGPACNMTCRHCSQTPIKNTYALKPSEELSPNVIDFIEKWLSVKPENSYSRIYFWGGEPLLYWNTIKKYILDFEQRGFNPRCYRLFSNGLLLNDEIAEFCNEHNILFTMSYDAPDSLAVRNAIPSEDNIKSFMKIKYRSINTVFNALNYNMVQAFSILEQKFPKTIVDMGVINVLSDIPKDIYVFQNGIIHNMINTLADEILSGNDPYGNRYRFFSEKYDYMVFHDNKSFRQEPWPPCAPGKNAISLRFNGDVALCHNTGIIIGNIAEPYLELYERHLEYWKKYVPEKCFSCPAVSICKNRCPIGIYTDDHTEYVHCKVLREIYTTIIQNKPRLTLPNAIKPYDDLRDWTRYIKPKTPA